MKPPLAIVGASTRSAAESAVRAGFQPLAADLFADADLQQIATTTRIRPGHDAQYAEYVQKLVNVAREKAKVDKLHVATFQVVSGAPGGTYLIFRPLKSLAEFDDPIAVRVRASMGDDMRKDADKAVSEAVLSSEISTYAFAPGMSYVEKEFAAADPGFWNPKPAMMAKPKPKKKIAKPAAPPPPTD